MVCAPDILFTSLGQMNTETRQLDHQIFIPSYTTIRSLDVHSQLNNEGKAIS